MHVGVLGPLVVRADGRDVTPRGQRSRDLFVVLLQRRGRPVSAYQLLHLVWGEQAVELDASAVHTVVARLRRRLGPGTVISHGSGYLIDTDTTTDEDAFGELIGQGREHARRAESLAACTAFRAALALWRGPEAFEDIRAELVEIDRSRLTDLRTTVIEELAATLLGNPMPGGLAEAGRLTSELIAQRPLRERPYQLAMLAAYRSDRQSEALQIYQDLRRLLRTELGIEPTPASADLQAMVLRQDPRLSAAATQSAPSMSRPARSPVPIGPLIGRAAELAAVRAALAGGRRLISIVGPGGVGKSRLLAEVGAASSRSATTPMRLLYTEMSGLGQVGSAEVAEAIAVGHLGLDGMRAPLASLVATLGEDSWLLLIDEAEWVIEPLAPVVSSILQGCPGVQIVLTSRIPLDLTGEYLVPIAPLGCPAGDAEAAMVLAAPAVEFLVQRLTDRAIAVDGDARTAELLALIARRVDGLPLALELAAGQAAGRSLADLALLVAAPLDVTAAGQPNNTRHRSLRDTLEWSMDRLDRDRLAVLRRLSVFVGRFDLADAAAVARPVTDIGPIVRALARDALVQVERSNAAQLNFRLLRSVRDLALEGLGPDELAAAQALHRQRFAARRRSNPADLVEDVREHLDDYVEALRTSLASRDGSTLADLTYILSQFWQVVDGEGPGLRWIGRVLAADVLGPAERAEVLVQRAALALHHDTELVLADTAQAISLLETAGVTATIVTALSIRAWELYARGRGDEASTHADRAVLAARHGAVGQLATALGTAALIHAVNERAGAATAAIAEARPYLDIIEAPAERISTGSLLALALVNLERFDDALELLDGIAGTAMARGAAPTLFLLTRGWAALGAGDLTVALLSFAASIPAAEPYPVDRLSAETLLGAGCTLAGLGHPSAAAALAAGLELMSRVEHLIPPALDRAVDRARRQVEHQSWPDFSTVQTRLLAQRFETNLTQVVADDRNLSKRA